MLIHGVELNFDLYDSRNIKLRKRYFQELKKIQGIAKAMPKNADEKTQTEYLCGRIKKMFDKVFSLGTGDAVCGEGNNLLRCMQAYEQLVSDQIRQNKEYNAVMEKIRIIKNDSSSDLTEAGLIPLEMSGDMDESTD